MVFYVALLAAFLLLLADKLGGVEWLQVHGNDFFHKMASCRFCLSWWVCVIVAVVWACVTGHWTVIFVPFFATPITRFLS